MEKKTVLSNRVQRIFLLAVLLGVVVFVSVLLIRETENELLSKREILSCEVYIDHNGNVGLGGDLDILKDDQVLRVTEKNISGVIKNYLTKASPFRPIVKELESFEKRPDYYDTDIILKNDLACYKIQFVDMQTQRQIDYLYRDQPVIRVTMLQETEDGELLEEWDYLFTVPSYEFFQLAILSCEYYGTDEIVELDALGLCAGW